MIVGTVTGAVNAPVRLSALGQVRFVQVTTEDGRKMVAADTLGAQTGNRVMLCQGDAAQAAMGGRCPVDAAVTGVLRDFEG